MRCRMLVFGALSLLGCGARTGLIVPQERDAEADAADAEPECRTDEDCPGADDLCAPVICRLPQGTCFALPVVACDDADPCTKDSCLPDTGGCAFDDLTFDLDGDGHRGPRPGFAVGDEGACGDDCDDTSKLAYPGNQEVCDGVDNDCNGIVDDGAAFVPADVDAIRISGDVAPAGPGGLGWSGDPDAGYLGAYTATVSGKTRVYTQRIAVTGDPIEAPEQLTFVNADAQGGFVAWTGDRYGVVWSDRRYNDYEVFFNITDAYGVKLIPDVRVSNAYGFSVYARTVFDGTAFLTVWQDDLVGVFSIYGQRIALDGTLVGENVLVAADGGYPAEAPSIAVGDHNVGLIWTSGGSFKHEIRFRTIDSELSPLGDPVTLTDPGGAGVYPEVVWNQSAYVAVWYDTDGPPYTIYGAVIDEAGVVQTPATPLATGPEHARYPWVMPLGDRLLLVFADDRDDNGGYELYAKMLTDHLEPASPDVRITNADGHSIYPMAAFGPGGDVGVLFRDDRIGEQHVFFTRLSCVVP